MTISTNYNRKPIPRSILIFGASGHIGGPLARFIQREAPNIRLRLASSRPEGCEALRRDFPDAEVITANYYDLASMELAVKSMEGIFVNTTLPKDERASMTNVITAVKKADCVVHLLRAGLGMQPEASERRIPVHMREFIGGDRIGKQLLEESDLPVTFFNFGASFMDNILNMKGGLQRERTLIWHNRRVPYMDTRDIAEAAGRVLLSDNHRHIGQFHTLNNGHDLMRYDDIARLMSQVFGEKIGYDGSKERFLSEYETLYGPILPMLWEFFEYEQDNEEVWALNDFMERTIGRKPITLREWLMENKRALLGLDQPTGSVSVPDDLPAAAPSPVANAAAEAASVVVDGIWDCTVATPVGKMPYELSVSSAVDGTLTGVMKDLKSGDSLALQNGKVSGNVLVWSMQLTKPIKLSLKCEVRIQGNEVSGIASAGMLGKSAINGVRRS